MSNPETWKKWEGRADGKFPLRQWLGGSDHSAVFLTERPGQTQKVAIKLIAADADADDQLVRWRAAAQLSHPHLMRIYDAGRCRMDGTPLLYLVMEYAEEDLSQILPQRPLAPAEVTDLLPPLLDSLSYLHSKGFVHGRVKPSNVHAMDDQLKLSADQIVSAAASNPASRRRDVYDAPETAAGIISPAGDVWSVGVTLVAADEPIVIPRDATEQVQYEGELVAVIGKRCKRVSEAEALDYVFGYTIGNDVSERTWQRGDRTLWRGKNTDTFKPMGPWIVTGLDPDDLRVTIRLNGREMFSYAVKDALFSVRQFISRMSQYLTLYPGDVLWMGTDGATENMKDGDVVEVEITDIGVLRNPVVRER